MEERKGWFQRTSEVAKRLSDAVPGPLGQVAMQGRYPAEVIQHPIDELAQRVLENRIASQRHVKGLIEKVATELETQFYLQNLADNIRASADLWPDLHRLFVDACTSLRVTPPSLFVDTNPVPNAFALGAAHPSIVITSGLLRLLREDELRFVLGHEIGHLLCGHTRYQVMAQRYEAIAALISPIPLVGPGFALLLQLALRFWYRRSELSADRFGVLSCREQASSPMSALAKLAGGSDNADGQALRNAILSQAREFRDGYLARGQVATMWDLLDGLTGSVSVLTHPWPGVRVWEIEAWLRSEHYKAVVAGEFDLARTERGRVESFFLLEGADISKDPFERLLAEFTGELGKGIGDLIERGKSLVDDVIRRAGKHEPPQS